MDQMDYRLGPALGVIVVLSSVVSLAVAFTGADGPWTTVKWVAGGMAIAAVIGLGMIGVVSQRRC